METLGVDGIGRRCHAHIVAMPYPGRGHINPMMNLCKMLVSRSQGQSPPAPAGDDQWGVAPGILVTFVVTEEWYGFIGSHSKPTAVRFRCIPNIIPSEVGRAADFPGFLHAVYTKMEAPFEHLLDSLDLPPTLIIADTYLPWAVSVCNRRNIPLASLWTMSASMFSILYHFHLLPANGHYPDDPAAVVGEDDDQRTVEYIPGISSIRIADLPTFFQGDGRKTLDLALRAVRMAPEAQYLIFTSAYELEPKVIDAIRAELIGLRVYPLGPVIPYLSKLLAANEEQPEDDSRRGDDVSEWLDSQPGGSVMYVSLGSFLSVSAAQKHEMAAGLRDSGVRYLWVTRSEAAAPSAQCGGRGLEVPWCDQLKVLCHDSVGGFWTHCGWNSAMEAAFAGVPMLACPIFWDQLPNSNIIVEEWKAGLRVNWKRAVGPENLVPREEIAQLVRRIMDFKCEEGQEMKRRAAVLGQICRRAVQKGGSSEANITAFFGDITTPPSGGLLSAAPEEDHHQRC